MSRQKSLSKRTAIRHAFRRLTLGEEGAALVEATITAPILVAMGMYTANFGLLFYNKMEVQNAAQAGAQWAIANGRCNASGINTAALNATQVGGVTVTPSSSCTDIQPSCSGWPSNTPSYFCGCSKDSSGNATVKVLSAGACTTPAPGATCNTSGVAGNYVTVTAKKSYNSLVPYGLITSTYTICPTATVRIQ
jgi:Flp pilus assembly protein TadG